MPVAAALMLANSVPCACQTSIVAAPSHITHMMVPIRSICLAEMGCVSMLTPYFRRPGVHVGA
jgi:hypothetical protein